MCVWLNGFFFFELGVSSTVERTLLTGHSQYRYLVTNKKKTMEGFSSSGSEESSLVCSVLVMIIVFGSCVCMCVFH